MKTIDVLRISLGNLRRTKFRSFLTISGVVIGISSILLLVSLGFGLEKITTSQIADMDSLLTITITQKKETASLEAGSKITDQTINEIKQVKNVKTVSPVVSMTGSVIIENTASEAIAIGLNSEYLDQEVNKIIIGRAFEKSDEIVISKSLAESISPDINNLIDKKAELKLINPDIIEDINSVQDINLNATIVGIEDCQAGNFIYTPIDLITRKSNNVVYSSLKVKVEDKNYIDQVTQNIKTLGYEVTTVKDLIDQIEKVYLIIQIVLGIFGAIGLLVATLGIINTMTISLIERIREIGIMKAIGASDSDVRRIFINESVLIGFLGGFVGVLIAYAIASGFNFIFYIFMTKAGQQPLEIFIISYKFALIMIGFSMLISLVAGIYPSYRAKKLKPLEALFQR